MEEQKQELEWFDSPNILSNFLIGIILIIVIVSQAFAIRNSLPVNSTLGSIMNHNSIYLFMLFYFIALKTRNGKLYFDYLNLAVIILYIISFIAAFLTIFQSFGIVPLINVILLALVSVYLFHSFLKNTKWWREFKLAKSPFNDINNDWYFLAILVIMVVHLLVTLIETTSFDGVILALFDAIYMLLFVRFIYLYNEYLISKELKKNNKDENRKLVTDKDE